MTEMDLKLIKINSSHYYKKIDGLGEKVVHNGKTLWNKFERVESELSSIVIQQHLRREMIVAHSLVDRFNICENIVFDYNGRNTDRFYHKAQLLLRENGFINFTAYNSKTPGHLHLYVHKGHTDLQEGKILAKNLKYWLKDILKNQEKIFSVVQAKTKL